MSEYRGEATDWSPERESEELEKRARWASRASELLKRFYLPGQVSTQQLDPAMEIGELNLMPDVREQLEARGIKTIADLRETEKVLLETILYHNDMAVRQIAELLEEVDYLASNE